MTETTACLICQSNDHSLWQPCAPFCYVKCNQCGLIYLSPRENKEIFENELKDRERPASHKRCPARVRRGVKWQLKFVKQYARGGKLLDVGCADGDFLKEASKHGFEVAGIEITKCFASQAKEQGINIIGNDIFQADLARETFDIITMWDTIEHLYQPLETVQKLCVLLRKGGWLFIFTPNIEGVSALLFGKDWQNIHPEGHLLLFSPKTLGALVEKTGLTVKNSRTTNIIMRDASVQLSGPGIFSRNGYLVNGKKTSLLKVFVNVFLRATSEVFPSLISFFKIGDHILLVAQKE